MLLGLRWTYLRGAGSGMKTVAGQPWISEGFSRFGAAIPFALFPRGDGRALELSALWGDASAPLTLYVGANAQPLQTLALQAV